MQPSVFAKKMPLHIREIVHQLGLVNACLVLLETVQAAEKSSFDNVSKISAYFTVGHAAPLSRRKTKVDGYVSALAISSNAFTALEVELLHLSTDSEHERKFADLIAVWSFAMGRQQSAQFEDMLASAVVIPARLDA